MGYIINGNNSTMTDVFVRLRYTAKIWLEVVVHTILNATLTTWF